MYINHEAVYSISSKCGLSVSYTNSLMLPPTMYTANFKRHTNLYFNPDSFLILISINLTLLPPHSHFPSPHCPLEAIASITVSLLLQLMITTVLAESSSFLSVLSKLFILRSSLQTWIRWCHFFLPFLTNFLSFHLPRFSLYINNVSSNVCWTFKFIYNLCGYLFTVHW